MMIQLNPPIFLQTPKGSALCYFLIDYGIENDLHWVCAQQDTGECWTWSNRDIRFEKNVTIGRVLGKNPVNVDDVRKCRHDWVFDENMILSCTKCKCSHALALAIFTKDNQRNKNE